MLLHEKDSTCACKNFKQSHQSGNFSCEGDPGLIDASGNASYPLYWYEIYANESGKKLFCERFTYNFDFDQCVNLHLGKDEGTWCFVDSACKTLNGGSQIND